MMQHVYSQIDALPALVFLLVVLGMVAVIWLAERVVRVLTVKRTRAEDRTLWDKPRRLDDMRKRVRGQA